MNPEDCIKYADIINIGEGYISLPKLVKSITEDWHDVTIPNIWIKDKTHIIKNKTNFLIKDLDTIPFADYSDDNKLFIDNNKIYYTNYNNHINKKYHIMSSLDCPFSCSFCCNNQLKYKNASIRRRTVENIIQELEIAKKIYQFQYVEFWDDVFTIDLNWLQAFTDEYKKRVNLPAFCYSQASTVNEDIVNKLHEAGIKKVTLGIQSGSERIRKESYNRYGTNKQIIEAANLFNKHKIFVNYDFIIGNPEETNNDMKKSFELILKLPHPLALSVSSLLYFPNCEITVRHLKNNLITRKDVEDISKKALKKFGLLIKLNSNKNYCYWSFMYFLAGYIKLTKTFKEILISKRFYKFSILIIVPIYYILQTMVYLQRKYPIFKRKVHL
ncbi:MAG: radical SAM protein [Candidatus Kaelpia imicola]|nr:radical SAM protein [Candidatus Kaelpia imicola]